MGKQLLTAIALLSALAGPRVLDAADAQGRFAIKGIGNTDCATFVKEIDQRSANAYMYGGWIYGFLTAENKASEATFDLVAWEDLDTLTSYLHAYCQQNPESRFAQAVFQLGEALRGDRIFSADQPVEISGNGEPVFIYQGMISRIQDRLRDADTDAAPTPTATTTGEWNDATRSALEAFQRANGLDVSGMPDQLTLHHLFRAGNQ